MTVWHDTKAALGTQAAASTNRDSIWYPALALEAIRLIQYTGPDGSRVVKLLASGTVLSSHWLTRGELMWDTTFFPHTRLERVGIIAYTAKVRSLSHYIPIPVESQRIDTTVSASLAEMNVSWKQESISRHTVVLLSSFNSHNSKSFDSSTFAINFPLPVDGGNQYDQNHKRSEATTFKGSQIITPKIYCMFILGWLANRNSGIYHWYIKKDCCWNCVNGTFWWYGVPLARWRHGCGMSRSGTAQKS